MYNQPAKAITKSASAYSEPPLEARKRAARTSIDGVASNWNLAGLPRLILKRPGNRTQPQVTRSMISVKSQELGAEFVKVGSIQNAEYGIIESGRLVAGLNASQNYLLTENVSLALADHSRMAPFVLGGDLDHPPADHEHDVAPLSSVQDDRVFG